MNTPSGEKKYWFPAKRYGWGWGFPCTWQGWVVTFIWVALIASGGIVFARQPRIYIPYCVGLGVLLIAICWIKGEPPRWRWGDDKGCNEDAVSSDTTAGLESRSNVLVWLFNPFHFIAGGRALVLGFLAMLGAGLLGALSNTHFDGVLDTHTGRHVPLWFFLSEGFVDWLCMAVVLLVLGKLVSKTTFRAIDIFGTQALARWPTVFVALLMMPDAIRRFGDAVMKSVTNPGTVPVLNPADTAITCLIIIAVIPVTCWMVYLMYKGFSVSCNVRGGKAVGFFVVGLIAAEVLSLFCIHSGLAHLITG